PYPGGAAPSFSYRLHVDDSPDVNAAGDIIGGNVSTGNQGTAFVSLDTGQLSSGYHQVSVDLLSGNFSGNSHSADTWVPIITQDDYGFGKGWNLAGEQRIIAPPTGVSGDIYWLRPDGYISNFASVGATASNDSNATQLQFNGGHYEL